jgi:hypothetical protein
MMIINIFFHNRKQIKVFLCRCSNILAFPEQTNLTDIQHVLYGENLGLTLPMRDPWSHMRLEDIRQYDIPELDKLFSCGVVSVMERLAAMAGWPDPPPREGTESPLLRRLENTVMYSTSDDTGSEDVPNCPLRGGAGG